MGKLVMGYWDCPVCGSKEIRGDVTNCPSCGRARGDVQFYLKGYAEGDVVSTQDAGNLSALSEEESEKISDNPDWYCSFCNSLNSDNKQVCGTCGASRADSEANYFDMLKKKKEREAAEIAAQPQPAAGKKPGRSRLFIILAVIVLAVVGLVLWMNGRKTGDWEVTGLSWERNVQIEEYRQVEESGWSLPADAELVTQRQEVRSYRQQLTGYRTEERTRQVYDHDEVVGYDQVDRGNGTIELVEKTRPVYRTETYTVEVPEYVNVPVMDTQYYYKVWKWMPSRTATASGNDHDTAWPELNLAENERELAQNSRSEVYRFTARNVKKPEETVSYRLSESDWMNINDKDLLHISVKNSGRDACICDEEGNRIADLLPDR